ncbi:polysaccharide biosynthesis protein [Lutibacter profundi]|uniref:Polysaccharide biosynthesis protein n=1 Tax=Lutibacter profundi TaxID=1622118 RepID=A0A0X8G6A6_9FLAO|nr:nucleoside-diphosphate sugar epimerase/dehydratase [Lutibacter profundi]AMC10851.1 polysaccharide biosynthesis protein [Lutibacter profundi]
MLKKGLKKLISKNAPRWLVLIIDIYIVTNTFFLAYFIRFNFTLNFDRSALLVQLPYVITAALVSFLIIGSYKGIIRHTGVKDAIHVFLANMLMLALLGGFVILNRNFNLIAKFTIPLSILVIHFLLNTIALIVSRYLFKEIYRYLISDIKSNKRILIYGAGDAGLLTYSVLTEDKDNDIQVVGFMDDDNNKRGKQINGLKVYELKNITPKFVLEKKIDEIIISIQKIKPLRLIEIVDKLSSLSVKVKIVPPVKNWIENKLNPQQIKSVHIEDLLGRDPIALDNSILKKEFNNKVVLITGAAGSIGSEIARQITNFKYQKLILIDQSESELYNLQQYFIHKKTQNITAIVADIRTKKRMESIVQEYQPTIIFHAAAYKHVPLMEDNPYEAVRVNVMGTKIMADLAIKYTVDKFVMVSTDKAVNPTNVMGATKRIAEMYINAVNNKGKTKFITTRFGNVLGSNGSVIPIFQSQIKNGGPLTVTHKEITRYFMTIPEACQLVLEAGAMGSGGEIFVFDMGESIKIYDLALNMIRLSGLNHPEDIDIQITGLRPGEKIKEELLGNGENTTATYHDKIMIATVKKIESSLVTKQINELCNFNNELNFELIVVKMKEIVPEFISNNSKYEMLDKAIN